VLSAINCCADFGVSNKVASSPDPYLICVVLRFWLTCFRRWVPSSVPLLCARNQENPKDMVLWNCEWHSLHGRGGQRVFHLAFRISVLENDALEAVSAMNNKEVEDKRLLVEIAKERAPEGEAKAGKKAEAKPAPARTEFPQELRQSFELQGRSVVLWGIANDLPLKRLRHRLNKAGNVEKVHYPINDHPAVQPGSCALVVTESREVANKMVSMLDNHMLHESKLLARRYEQGQPARCLLAVIACSSLTGRTWSSLPTWQSVVVVLLSETCRLN
jgi:hypothetical protein